MHGNGISCDMNELLRSQVKSRKDFKKPPSTNEIPDSSYATAWHVTKLAKKKQGYAGNMAHMNGSAYLKQTVAIVLRSK
jgi:hypothetical protein